jgi:hypothetical protein
MLKIKLSIKLLIIIGLLFSCNQKKKKLYCYERENRGQISYYSIKIEKENDNKALHIYNYKLDVDFKWQADSYRDTIEWRASRDTLFYKFYQFPLKNEKNCLTYEVNLKQNEEIAPPGFKYQACLDKLVKDTIINNLKISTLGIYTVLFEEHKVLKVMLDLERKIMISEVSDIHSEQLTDLKKN